jgi:hypothetical protein
MLTLPNILRKNGFTYTKILRGERSCIYEQRVAENLKYHEVFVVKIKPRQVFENGKTYPKREVFPSNEEFGKTAWSFRTLNEALVRFKELVEKPKTLPNTKGSKKKL